jgi:flavin reductase (DIM6/NTAB) family NADH-FMN oxidoreductase RutF
MRRDVDLAEAKWLLEPGCVVLATSGAAGRRNVMTFSWQTPVQGWKPGRAGEASAEPCLVLLSINRSRYTHELIRETPEIVVNVPGAGLVDAVHGAGTRTGRGFDKFRANSLTPLPSRRVSPPIIAECIASLECAIRRFVPVGAHDLLVCEVLRAEAEEDLFAGRWIPDRAKTLHYLGGRAYGVLERCVEAAAGGRG